MDTPKNNAKRITGDPAQPSRPISKMATEFEIRDTITTVREALDRSNFVTPNLWVFFSNKNDRLLTIQGDLNFIVCVLLEGDCTVSNYLFDSSQDTTTYLRVVVTRNTGNREIYACGTKEEQKRRLASSAIRSEDNPSINLTERDLAPRMAEFANWLMLSGAMTRVRSFSTAAEVDALLAALRSSESISFREALSLPGIDPALMLGGIAKGLAAGVLV